MSSQPRIEQIDELMEKASKALTRTRYFEAEQLAAKALAMARAENDFDRMARICLPLQESRRLRLQQALSAKKIRVINEGINETMKIPAGGGCWLVCPPLVGANARQLRLQALAQEIPVAVLCHEPLTRTGDWPIVAIAPGVTVRVKLDPPVNPAKPDMAWFTEAMEALGDAAIASVDTESEPDRRVDALLLRLDAVPEHELLHQALADACREAQHAALTRPVSAACTTPKEWDVEESDDED